MDSPSRTIKMIENVGKEAGEWRIASFAISHKKGLDYALFGL